MRGFVLFSIFFFVPVQFAHITAAHAFDFTLTDVSILLPLPSLEDNSCLFNSQTKGAAGDLIPKRLLTLVPKLAPNVSSAQLRALAFRIDPCFGPMPAVPRPCHAQIRIVWQPLSQIYGETVAVDAALHSFYELTDQEMRSVLSEIAALSRRYGIHADAAPLTVSPIILKQGFNGPYWHQLGRLILNYSGEKRLSRLTFMTMAQPNQMWVFGGFDLVHGRIERTPIPRLEKMVQVFVNREGAAGQFLGGAKAEPDGADTFNSIIVHSSDLRLSGANILKQDTAATHRIENPLIHSPQTIDCVSCHVAQAARSWATNHFSELELGRSPFKFQSPFNLANLSLDQNSTENLRAFGYLGRNAAISQRTINETANLVDRLSELQAFER